MNGILLIDKPEGWTSNDVVVKLKGILHERRIGHSGTLDPMATGLLVVFIGRATRAVQFAEADRKRYIAGIHFGCETDTQDITGNVLAEGWAEIDRNRLEAALPSFHGRQEQIPPMYSALKVNGKKLYEYARSGIELERKAREIEIFSLTAVSGEQGDFVLDVECSKGTYIRTLCSDIGKRLDTCACMSSLRRVQAGVFSVDRAIELKSLLNPEGRELALEHLLPVDELFQSLPEYIVSAAQEKKIRCGNVTGVVVSDGVYRIYSERKEFLMLGRVESGKLITVKSFFEVE